MVFNRFFLYNFLICFCLFSFGQEPGANRYADSLQNIIDSTSDVKFIKKQKFLLGRYFEERDPEYAKEIGLDLIENYVKKDDSVGLRKAYYILGSSHNMLGDFKTALKYYSKIYLFSKGRKDSLDIALSGHLLGNIYMAIGNMTLSQDYLLEASFIYNKLGNNAQKAGIGNSLASFYSDLEQPLKAEKEYLKALSAFKKLNDSMGMAHIHANLGLLYTEMSRFTEAEFHLLKERGLNAAFPTLTEMGYHHDYFGYLRQHEGRYEEAYKAYLKSYEIRKNLASTYDICESAISIAEILILLNRPKEALKYLNKVFEYEEHQSLHQQERAHRLLSKAYENIGAYKTSIKHHKLLKVISDSIYSKTSLQTIADKDAKYEKQKKDSEILLLSKEKKILESEASKSRIVRGIAIFVIVILLVGGVLLLWFNSKINNKNKIISNALKDKELLLHETHHRVKNNLQMISSLLNLQSNYVRDDSAREVLKNNQNRIYSLAILHKNIYNGDSLSTVNIQTYFEGLVDNIFSAFEKTTANIIVNIEAKNVFMNFESAISVGLIVNEIIGNSVKHAFPDQAIVSPKINLVCEEINGLYQIEIKDNGVGYDMANRQSEESFGLKLVELFSSKLNGKVSIKSNKGVIFKIDFQKQST
ncbi:MAG: tetratricopeptide repeat protein [Winogradskyella sp.]|uniref:tetratricopeptide repeat-containing sensor histidine kinase n=1 Tax=Winogradskyella sp. TaxID=1883156 RepID=UPI0025D4C00C|nr:histidine kinase dimerization/phosphoacceptor domain -containing protein [Winogradskyella sp.]NRB59891.1 tetratricopeptide repeat protein [Winogradskyella sp.]